ncbi:unnamed protein product [Alternaria alternata]
MNCLGLSWADLRLRANAGCDFTQYLKGELEHKVYKDADPDTIQLYTQGRYRSFIIEPLICLQSLHHQDDIFGGKDISRYFVTAGEEGDLLCIYCTLTKTLGDDLYEGVKIEKSIAHDPLSARTVTDVRGWLKCCKDERDGYHKICSLSERAYVPTRLIKLSGPLDKLQLRIVCRNDLEEHDMSRYVALSYCWGGDQTNKLTQENHGLYKKNITWESLPRTIQDAARTAQVLGFHYIWIDSMCIVQDSKEDKEAEISQMTKVYAHATLTVVNKRGNKVTEGFLHPRTLPSGTSSIQFRTEKGQTHRLTLSFDSACRLEENFAIDTRGWTLQEHLLSRRRLIIGTWSTEWHCRREVRDRRDGWVHNRRRGPVEGIPSDDLHVGWAGHNPLDTWGSKEAESVYGSRSFINAAMFFSVNPGYPSGRLTQEQVRRSWYTIVESYSSRSVTEPEDRQLAISGIAERFANFIPGRYIAGIWENMMPASLLWSNFGEPIDKPVEYRGPSWSWISIDGGVMHNSGSNCICEVVLIEYMPKSAEALYGAVRSAALHIKGPALSVEWRYTRQGKQRRDDTQSHKDLSQFRWREGSDEYQDPQLTVNLDAREQTTEWREVVLLAYVFSNHGLDYRDTWFIVLTKVDQVEVENEPRHRFRRLGTGHFGYISPLPNVESWPVSSHYVI